MFPRRESGLSSHHRANIVTRVTWLALFLFAGPGHAVFADDAPNPKWEPDIQAIEKKVTSGQTKKNGYVFVGSSSIRLWKLDTSFPKLPVSNHGFGGSVLSDSVDYFDRLVTAAEPQIIVVYAGDNDVAAGKKPETIADDFQEFLGLVHSKVPSCKKVIYISIKPSVKRWAMADTMQKTNRLIKDLCTADEKAEFLDIWPLMLNADGMPRPELLAEDGLHLNEAGYTIWNDALRPLLTLEAAALKQ